MLLLSVFKAGKAFAIKGIGEQRFVSFGLRIISNNNIVAGRCI